MAFHCILAGLLVMTACTPIPSTASAPLYPLINLTSPAFTDNTTIPAAYTCTGAGTSPELTWSEPPTDTKSFALIVDDIDAPGGNFVHWVIYNIPAEDRQLSASIPSEANLSNGSLQGLNSAGSIGYIGPCPPSGTHRYIFSLYALDTLLPKTPAVNRDGLLKLMQGHILAKGQLTGLFAK